MQLKKQFMGAILGCILLTLGFGTALSIAVNLSLHSLEQQPDLEILPAAERGTSAAPL